MMELGPKNKNCNMYGLGALIPYWLIRNVGGVWALVPCLSIQYVWFLGINSLDDRHLASPYMHIDVLYYQISYTYHI